MTNAVLWIFHIQSALTKIFLEYLYCAIHIINEAECQNYDYGFEILEVMVLQACGV